MMKNFSIAPLSALAHGDVAPPSDVHSKAAPGAPVEAHGRTDDTAPCRADHRHPTGASPEEIKDWLRLCHTPGIPPAAVRRLLTVFGLPAAILQASRDDLARIVPPALVARLLARTSPDLGEQIARTLAWARQPGCGVGTLSEPAYPRALLALGDAPPILYCRGDAGLPNRAGAMTAALVGSRRATPQGCDDARHVARVLGDAGVNVVSGLAAGIDAAAHDGALDTPGGTCAVVGTGADIVYPARHGALAERIAASGLLLSTFPIGTPPRPDHFPRRNRLIAALARCTLVVEAATQSGSLITARLAGELGRDVLAVPGSIHAPQSRGCHALIRDGATLATGPEDVLEALGAGNPLRPAPDVADQASVASTACVTSPSATSPVRPLPPGRAAILEALGYDPVSADTLCGRTGLGIAEVLAHLGALELDASVARLPGGRFVRHRPRGGAR